MKITITKKEGKATINEDFEIENGFLINDQVGLIDSVQDGFVQVPKIAYLFYELKKDKELEVEADEELKELLQLLNNQSDDESDVY